jgi:hypothetical protein
METRLLPVKLTDEEVALKSSELARDVKTRDELEESRKEENTRRKDDIELYDKSIRSNAAAVRSREELREVEVEWRANLERRMMDLFRLDTDERIEQRSMTDEEHAAARQGNLSLHRGRKKADTPPAAES